MHKNRNELLVAQRWQTGVPSFHACYKLHMLYNYNRYKCCKKGKCVLTNQTNSFFYVAKDF